MERCQLAPPTVPLPGGEDLLQDQSQCWVRGEHLPVEAYLQLHPGLEADRELVLDLICHEIHLRARQGETPDPEEYLRRFPSFAEDLRAQFEVRRALAEEGEDLATIVEEPDLPRASDGWPRVQGYEILRELGRGGMGVVYLARHLGLKRLVALKMIHAVVQYHPRQQARFHREAEVLARLQHPNIIQIYEAGECAGTPFLALEYLPGGGLDRRLGSPQAPRPAAQLLWALARAVEAAHRAGVVHRDLKPANVLLAADGTPKVTDFGLAKRLGDEGGQTRTGDILGTPYYMAPEQAYGHRGDVGTWTDVYALGAIFYELLTGRPPFNGATVWDTLEQMAASDPVPPRRLQSKVPRDLEVICLKCLAKEPARRYARAGELAEDLRLFLAGEPIRARPAGAWERAWKWVRRRPVLAVLGGASVVSVLVLLVAVFAWLRAAASSALLMAREAQERASVALSLADLKEGLYQVESACSGLRWEEARARLDGVTRQLDVARQTFPNTPPLEELQSRANDLRGPIERRLNARERLDRFRTLRTEAGFLVMGLAGMDPNARQDRCVSAVAEAFGLFGAEPGAGPLPEADLPTLSEGERREAREGWCEMLLGLAQVEAEGPGEDPSGGARAAERALALLDRAERLYVSPGICHARRARLLCRRGQHAEARRQEELARADPPARAFEFFLRGSDLYADGDLDGAVEAFEKALGLEPKHAAAAYALALPHLRLRLRADQPTVARAHLEVARLSLTTCINQQPGLPWPYLCRAFAQGELDEFRSAEADFSAAEKILHARPDDGARYALLVSRGAFRLRRGQPAEAVEDLTEAVKLRPGDYQAHVNLARAFQERRQPEEALRQILRAVELGPPAAQAALHRTRARLHQEAGRAQEAAQDLDEAARLEAGGPMSPPAAEDWLAKGGLLARAGDYPGAVEALDAALAASPGHPEALRARADVLLLLQRPREALRDLDRLLEGERGRQSGLVPFYRARAGARSRLGDPKGAIEDYTRALGLEPNQPADYAARGWCFLALDAPALAQPDFEQAFRLDPRDEQSLSGRALARVQLGRCREAVADAEQALRLGRPTPRNRYNAARVFAQASRNEGEGGRPRPLTGRDLALEYQDRAVALLRDAFAALPVGERRGFWAESVQRDTALVPIRQCLGYRQLAAEYASEAPSSER